MTAVRLAPYCPHSVEEHPLEMEPDLGRHRAWRHIVRPAEGREKVIQRQLVTHIDGGNPQTPFVTFAFEQVVVAHRNIKQVTGSDARRTGHLRLFVNQLRKKVEPNSQSPAVETDTYEIFSFIYDFFMHIRLC